MQRFYTRNILNTIKAIERSGGSVGSILTDEIINFAESLERNGILLDYKSISKQESQ